MYFFGAVVGYIILGLLSDNIGRKVTLYVTLLLASNIYVVEIGMFIIGFGVNGTYNVFFNYSN
jgi:MFS family permease